MKLEPGCTAILGMCSRLPYVLHPNLACFSQARWPDLKELLVVVDGPGESLDPGFETFILEEFPDIRIRFLYYSERQACVADKLQLPYVYSWLSWAIGMAHATTTTVFLQDYDALVLEPILADRYQKFTSSNSVIQGISWYQGGGIVREDRLATTFEAFVDLTWIRAAPPLAMFHKIGRLNGRLVDFDTTLALQANSASVGHRQCYPKREAELMHPSQMIHQYTMFRRNPGRALPCFAIPMIPFFKFLANDADALNRAADLLHKAKGRPCFFLEDDALINLQKLNVAQLQWCLKQMLRACVTLAIEPTSSLRTYGEVLNQYLNKPASNIWNGDLEPDQQRWLQAC